MGRIARLQSTVLRENVLSLVDSRIYTGAYNTIFYDVNIEKPSLNREIVLVVGTPGQMSLGGHININGISMYPFIIRETASYRALGIVKVHYPEGEIANISLNFGTSRGICMAVYRSSYRLTKLSAGTSLNSLDITKLDGTVCLCASISILDTSNIFNGFVQDISVDLPTRYNLKVGRFIEGETASIFGDLCGYVTFSIY